MVRDANSYADQAAARIALGSLPQADLVRLSRIARLRALGLAGTDAEDLLNEAIVRVLDGRRRWPLDVPMVAFLAQVMRSIADEEREREGRSAAGEWDDMAGLADDQPEPPRAIDAKERLDTVFARFAGDGDVLALIDGHAEDETTAETRARTGMDAKRYDAARKRLKRTLEKMMAEGQL